MQFLINQILKDKIKKKKQKKKQQESTRVDLSTCNSVCEIRITIIKFNSQSTH
jgi:hypothetical protein